ncbi:hypothetical protein [Kitasatospora sp. NPDC088351]|uniref:SCO2583/SCO2584 N-terminal domain-containing protein n=1 Tax=Kitasatospora sp. NPDC088351 TaxID=3155180 RepID=UPI003430BB52
MPIAEDPEPRPSEGREPGGSDPSEAGGKDPFADLVLDEEFVKGATVKEQSGRTRMLAARWRHTPPVDPGGRRSVNDGPSKGKRFGRGPRRPDAFGNPGPRRRLEWRAPLYVVLTIAVLLAALNIDGLRSWYSEHYGDAGTPGSSAVAPAPTVAPETARPTAAPPSAAEQQPTVDHPWAGSPAEGWPSGAEAFVLPAAQATGVFGAEEVAGQLQLVKDYLTAANLDPKVTAGGRPEAALALLDRGDRDSAEAALAKPSEERNAISYFSRFNPAEAIPVTDVVKVQGRTTFESDGEKGVLVHTDYTFVYAIRPGPEAAKQALPGKPSTRPSTTGEPAPGLPSGPGVAKPVALTSVNGDVPGDTWTARTIVRRITDFRFYDPARYQSNPKKINLRRYDSESGNSACNVHDGYYHPQFDQFAQPDPERTGPSLDPYDRSKDIDGERECGSVSRS